MQQKWWLNIEDVQRLMSWTNLLSVEQKAAVMLDVSLAKIIPLPENLKRKQTFYGLLKGAAECRTILLNDIMSQNEKETEAMWNLFVGKVLES